MSNERRTHLTEVLNTGKISDSQMLEVVIRMAFHDDGTPRDFTQVGLRDTLERHPYFKLILKEGVDE